MEPNSYERIACHEQDSSLNDRRTQCRKQANATRDIIRWRPLWCSELMKRKHLNTGAAQSGPHSGSPGAARGEEQQGALPWHFAWTQLKHHKLWCAEDQISQAKVVKNTSPTRATVWTKQWWTRLWHQHRQANLVSRTPTLTLGRTLRKFYPRLIRKKIFRNVCVMEEKD